MSSLGSVNADLENTRVKNDKKNQFPSQIHGTNKSIYLREWLIFLQGNLVGKHTIPIR